MGKYAITPEGPLSFRESILAGGVSPPVRIPAAGASVTAAPAAGGTMRVFKSTSPWANIQADIADASLTYANLIAGTQPTSSVWMLWKSGAVTATANEGPVESAGDVAIIATATTQAGVLEVAG